MKAERVKGNRERAILTALIVDKRVLAKIAARWKEPGPFRSKWSNLVGDWCVTYFERYGTAPGKRIQYKYENWVRDNPRDTATADTLERFLGDLSDAYEALAAESNPDHALDMAQEHFERVAMERLVENVQAELDTGTVKRARREIVDYSMMDLAADSGVDVLQDKVAVQEALDEEMEALIEYPGALQKFFSNHLQRDGFIAVQAPEKRGKSFWLEDLAWRGVLQRRRVAYFSVGDLSKKQMMRRFIARAALRPISAREYRYPIAIRKRKDHEVEVRYDFRETQNHINWQSAWKAFLRIQEKTRTRDPLLKLSVHPMNTINVAGIEAVLDEWEQQEEWVADVVVVDYADILMADGETERDRQNASWKGLRGLSQKRHILVATGTQANAASYEQETQGMGNFSEDKRKYGHATGVFGVNQTLEEKHKQVQRLNWLVLREGEFFNDVCVYVAGCLDVAQPAVKSCWQQRD